MNAMRTLLVFLKYPAPGKVKTRLAESLGPARAAELYREWIGAVLSQVQPVRDSARLVACFDGAAEPEFAPWHGLADAWWPQAAGDLGDRLTAAFETWQLAPHSAVAIGTDCLDLEAAHVESAFARLESHDVVFGPATDGGYYLVGLARRLPDFFRDVPWSSVTTLAVHQAICTRNGWSCDVLSPLCDIDTGEDWSAYQRRMQAGP
jgi:rSAM/selenodomain-associated transferase 1